MATVGLADLRGVVAAIAVIDMFDTFRGIAFLYFAIVVVSYSCANISPCETYSENGFTKEKLGHRNYRDTRQPS